MQWDPTFQLCEYVLKVSAKSNKLKEIKQYCLLFAIFQLEFQLCKMCLPLS